MEVVICALCVEIKKGMRAIEVGKALGEFEVPEDHVVDLAKVLSDNFDVEELLQVVGVIKTKKWKKGKMRWLFLWRVRVDGTFSGNHVGCSDLLKKVQEVKPDIHVCGHIHVHGHSQLHRDGTSFYNVSICDEQYFPSNPITVIEYEKE